MNWALIQNSLLVSGAATVVALALGAGVALWVMTLGRFGRASVLALAGIAFMLPPFLIANTWLHYFGYNGVWRDVLPVNLFTPAGTAWILALLTWPVTTFLLVGAWQRIAPEQLEADSALQRGALVRDLLWPMGRNALVLATALSLVLTMNNFSIPAILQTKVFPAEMWLRFNTTFDQWGALQMSWPMILVPLAMLLFVRVRTFQLPARQTPVPAMLFRQRLGGNWRAMGVGVSLVAIGFSVGLPALQILSSERTWMDLPPALAAGGPAVWTSFWTAALTATLVLLAGLLGARFKGGWLFWLVFLTPGVLMGIALITIFNRPLFTAFYQSSGMVIFALTLRYVALGWQGARAVRQSLDREVSEAAQLLGASAWRRFWEIERPQASAALLAIWYVVYLFCLWDVETLVLIIPPGMETVSVRVFNLLHYGHSAHVNALCFMLLLLAFVPLVVGTVLSRMGALAAQRRAFLSLGLLALALPLLAGCVPQNTAEGDFHSQFFSRVEIIGTRGAGLGQFNKPRSVALDAEDNLYVVDMTGRVQKFSPDGKFLLSWQMPQTDKGRPKGMCQDEHGKVVVVEPHYSRVNHFSEVGKLMTQWGTHGTNSGMLSFPRAVAVHTNGNVYLSEYGAVERVQMFAAQGAKFIGTFGHEGEGEGEFARPEGLGLDRQGNVYVADSCNHRIQIFTPEGKFVRTYGHAGPGAGELSYPYDVRVDANGFQFVCEFGNSRIQVFDLKDHSVEIIGHPGSAPGQFANPWSIAFDSRGNLYVADSMNHRVQKFVRRQVISRNPAPSPAARLVSLAVSLAGKEGG